MSTMPKVGQWLNENFRVVGIVGELAIVELIPGWCHEVKHIQYFVRVGSNNYLRADGTEGFNKAMFDTQDEAEHAARERMAAKAEAAEQQKTGAGE